MGITRREFLESVAATGTALSCGVTAEGGTGTLPARTLGKTGARVSILAMGAGSRYQKDQKFKGRGYPGLG